MARGGVVKAILFDYNGVFTLGKDSPKAVRGHHKLGFHEYVSKKLQIKLDKWFDAIDSHYAKSIEGKESEKNVVKKISENLEISQKKLKQIVRESYGKNFKDNEVLFEQVKKLKQKYILAILSDQWCLSYRYLVNKKYLRHFKKKFFSHQIGMRKPNLDTYKFVSKKLNLKPSEIVFVDDREWNLKPAKKLGMKTILFKNNEQLFKQLSKLEINHDA